METLKQLLKRLRGKFDSACRGRDKYTCVMCGRKGVKMSVHHIMDRHLLPNDGYSESNGITLCDEPLAIHLPSCHMQAEEYHKSSGKVFVDGYHPLDLYEKIGSSFEKAWKDSQAMRPENVDHQLLVYVDRDGHDVYLHHGLRLKSDEEVLAAMSEEEKQKARDDWNSLTVADWPKVGNDERGAS